MPEVKRENADTPGPSPVEAGDAYALDEARMAEEETYLPPSTPRRFGGQAILTLQKIYEKLLAGRVVQLQDQVTNQDRELARLTYDVGELTAQVVQMNVLLRSIDERLARLEKTPRPSDLE